MKKTHLILFVLFTSTLSQANAQMAVIDVSSISRQIEQIVELKNQLDTLNRQLQQAEQLYGSMNKLTNMADVANVLNNPDIRRALPSDFASVEANLNGIAKGNLGSSSANFLNQNRTYDSSNSTDAYSTELQRDQNRNAGQLGLGQQIFDAASQRIDGLDQLRQKISTSSDAKDISDLQARLQSEIAYLQVDQLRMQALRMIQQAQVQVEEQRGKEDWIKRLNVLEKITK